MFLCSMYTCREIALFGKALVNHLNGVVTHTLLVSFDYHLVILNQ